jgi:hypothetical protein
MLLLFLFVACGEDGDSGGSFDCPPIDEDSCMTEELYEECLAVSESCEGAVAVMESCPYAGFTCSE